MNTLILTMILWLLPSAAAAHHFMDGGTPRVWYEGLLSGLAHPVMGLDHLLFVVACGWVAFQLARLRAPYSGWLPFVLMGGTVAGCYGHDGIDLAFAELLIAVTLLLLGVVMVTARSLSLSLPLPLWMVFFGLAGLIHGYAYGESISGASSITTAFYVVGFCVMQYVLMRMMRYGLAGNSFLAHARAPMVGGGVLCLWALSMTL